MALWLAGAASTAMVLSFALTWTVRQIARKRGWVKGPITRRHIHSVPVPRLGGVAISLALAATITLFPRESCWTHLHLALLIPSGWMFTVGLADDIYGLRANGKLAGQVIGGALLILLGMRIQPPSFLPSGVMALLFSAAATLVWAVTVMNAINLVDGLDGLACGSSLFIVSAVMAIGLFANDFESAVLAASLAGAIIGFLFFNTHPASIFLGDSGSLFLGVVIAGLTIRIINANPTGWVACVLMLAHPLGEVVVSVTRRFLRADPIFRPDRRHMHHRLLDRGLSHVQASCTLAAASLLGCVLGSLAILGGYVTVSTTLIALSAGALALVELRYREYNHLGRWLRRLRQQREIVSAHMGLEEFRTRIGPIRTLTDFRVELRKVLMAIGFDDVRLNVRSYDSPTRTKQLHAPFVSMSFPLHTSVSRIGILELEWNSTRNQFPLDPEFFVKEFLPELVHKVEALTVVYGELPRTKLKPRVNEALPALVTESPQAALGVSLNS